MSNLFDAIATGVAHGGFEESNTVAPKTVTRTIVGNNQTLLDMALQATGTIEGALALVAQNATAVTISTTVAQGTELRYKESDIKNKTITSVLTGIKKPATGGGFTGSIDGEYDMNDYNNSQYKV